MKALKPTKPCCEAMRVNLADKFVRRAHVVGFAVVNRTGCFTDIRFCPWCGSKLPHFGAPQLVFSGDELRTRTRRGRAA